MFAAQINQGLLLKAIFIDFFLLWHQVAVSFLLSAPSLHHNRIHFTVALFQGKILRPIF